MEQEICLFNGKEVSFSIEKENGLMVNATEMAKIFDADVQEFTRNIGTENFIKALCQTENSRFENEFLPDGIFVKIMKGGRRSGTWMDRRVALKFAAWLDPKFEGWVYSAVEDLMYGKLVKREKARERTMAIQEEIEYLLDKPDKSGGDFRRYINLQKQLKYEVAFRRALTVADLSGMRSLFENKDLNIKFLSNE
jgi:hypothetical protein